MKKDAKIQSIYQKKDTKLKLIIILTKFHMKNGQSKYTNVGTLYAYATNTALWSVGQRAAKLQAIKINENDLTPIILG